jgi:hypothetical protein
MAPRFCHLHTCINVNCLILPIYRQNLSALDLSGFPFVKYH